MERSKNVVIAVLIAAVVFLLAERDWTDGDQKAGLQIEQASIAVLRFSSATNDGIESLSDQLAVLLIHNLANDPDLIVASKLLFWDADSSYESIRAAVRDLGIRYWVEGSVYGDGERVVITVQLIDAETEMHLWSETYFRKRGDSWNLMEVPGAISEAIRFELDPSRNRSAKST